MKSPIDPDLTITESCGNVFLDLGFPPPEKRRYWRYAPI